MVIHKAYNSLHRSIKESFSLFAFSSGMSSKFPRAMREKRGCVMYFISIGRAYLIQLLHILTTEGRWKSFENQWAEAGKTKIIDCFPTPAGGGITKQNNSQGCLKLLFCKSVSRASKKREEW